MKKQILILVSVAIIAIGFFFLTRHSNSNSGVLFETGAERVGVTEIDDEIEIEKEGTARETVRDERVRTVFVDVQGEVINPGVFEVNNDVRIGHLIELAGGLTADANTRGLNQAARIYDEMVIFIPHRDDIIDNPIETPNATNNRETSADDSNLISLSTASALELQTLPGIGPAISANIIAHREANGAFSSVDELANVAGIGARTVENIRELVKP